MKTKELCKILRKLSKDNGDLPIVVWKDKRGYPEIVGAQVTKTLEPDGKSEHVIELWIGR